MESLIRTAVFEISQIFEDSLHDHQVELARKGEEIAFLKVKLQWAELRLREVSVGNTTDQNINASLESPSVSVEPSPHQSWTAPETDIDVTDDWCVPLDPENNQESDCPSVRLRQFSIPLFPIPLKHEAFTKLEASNIGPQLNKDTAQPGLQEESKPKRKRGRPRKIKFPLTLSESEKVKEGPLNIKEESFDSNVEQLTQNVRRRRRHLRMHKIRKLKRRNTTETQANNSSVKGYPCRFCPKVFDTAFGLSVHDRAHKKCKGCKRIFSFPSMLVQHKETCRFYKKIMKSSRVSPKSVPIANSSSIEKVKPVVQIRSNRKKGFTCKGCQKKFKSRSLLLKHPCFVSCKTCHKRLSNRMSLAVHIAKMHKSLADLKQLKSEPWTKPLDEVEDGQENKLPHKEKSKGLYKKCPQGFKCLICKKVYIAKYSVIEHTFIHTGERPFKCAVCLKSFSQRNALSNHRRKEHGMVIRKCKICACSKRFFAKSTYKEHKLICPKAGK